MRLSLIVTLGLLGLAGCVNNPPPEAPAAVVAVPPTTTYVTPSPMVVPAPGTTVITHP
ncbi:MAG: hypothetical protein WBQ75_01900 [Acetobacteraceae bacterium]